MEQQRKTFAHLHYEDVCCAIKALEELEEGCADNLNPQEVRSLKKFKAIKGNMEKRFHPVTEALNGKVVTINRVTAIEPEVA